MATVTSNEQPGTLQQQKPPRDGNFSRSFVYEVTPENFVYSPEVYTMGK
jgi:hypothetical protein